MKAKTEEQKRREGTTARHSCGKFLGFKEYKVGTDPLTDEPLYSRPFREECGGRLNGLFVRRSEKGKLRWHIIGYICDVCSRIVWNEEGLMKAGIPLPKLEVPSEAVQEALSKQLDEKVREQVRQITMGTQS